MSHAKSEQFLVTTFDGRDVFMHSGHTSWNVLEVLEFCHLSWNVLEHPGNWSFVLEMSWNSSLSDLTKFLFKFHNPLG